MLFCLKKGRHNSWHGHGGWGSHREEDDLTSVEHNENSRAFLDELIPWESLEDKNLSKIERKSKKERNEREEIIWGPVLDPSQEKEKMDTFSSFGTWEPEVDEKEKEKDAKEIGGIDENLWKECFLKGGKELFIKKEARFYDLLLRLACKVGKLKKKEDTTHILGKIPKWERSTSIGGLHGETCAEKVEFYERLFRLGVGEWIKDFHKCEDVKIDSNTSPTWDV